jgi:hypothetical protein
MLQSTGDKVLESGPFERLFTGNATARMLDFLVASQEFDYSESDIARYSGVSLRHAQLAIPKLAVLGIIFQTRTSGRSKMYRLNKNDKAGVILEQLAFQLTGAEIRAEAGMEVTPVRL